MVRIVFTRSPLAVDLHPRHRAAVSHDARKAVDTCPEARKASLNTPADSRQCALRRAGVRGGLERLSQEHSGRHAVSDRRDNVGLYRVPEQTGRHSVALPVHTRRSAAREPSLDRAIFPVVTIGRTRARPARAAVTSPFRDAGPPRGALWTRAPALGRDQMHRTDGGPTRWIPKRRVRQCSREREITVRRHWTEAGRPFCRGSQAVQCEESLGPPESAPGSSDRRVGLARLRATWCSSPTCTATTPTGWRATSSRAPSRS
jgi:hypothetical protein